MKNLSPWRRALGVFLIVCGLAALITPFTPGSWLIFIGAEILGIEFLYASNIREFAKTHASWFAIIFCFVSMALVIAFLDWYAR